MINETDNDIIDLEQSMKELNYEYDAFKPKLLIFGVGGGGVNTVNSIIDCVKASEVEFVVANTDAQTLRNSKAEKKILLGNMQDMKGLGAGADPLVGKKAAEESLYEIEKVLEGVNMVFLTAGMGGGTGTGAVSVIAKKAKEMGILVAAIVTKPFVNEGANRMTIAEEGIEELKKYVDTLIIIPNENLLRVVNQNTTFKESLQIVDDVLKNGVRGIVDVLTKPGYINVDFADLRTVMNKQGMAMMGIGEASGADRAKKALEEALSNPLLDNVSIKGAKGIIINITGSPDMTMFEYNEITQAIQKEINNSYANIITGCVFDGNFKDTIRVSIFATGINSNDENDKIKKEDKINNNELDKYKTEKLIEKTNNNFADKSINKQQLLQNTVDLKQNIKTNLEDNKKPVANNIVIEEDYFDMGETEQYNEFKQETNYMNNRTSGYRNDYKTETNNYFTNTNSSVNSDTFSRNSDENISNSTSIEEKQIAQKKQGFFKSLFSGNKNNNDLSNKNGFDDDDIGININYYTNVPSYLRDKK